MHIGNSRSRIDVRIHVEIGGGGRGLALGLKLGLDIIDTMLHDIIVDLLSEIHIHLSLRLCGRTRLRM